jgi:hypothetical protein
LAYNPVISTCKPALPAKALLLDRFSCRMAVSCCNTHRPTANTPLPKPMLMPNLRVLGQQVQRVPLVLPVLRAPMALPDQPGRKARRGHKAFLA